MKYAHRTITVVATVDDVKLVFEDRLIARHRRHWGMASLEELSTAVEYATSPGIADADTIRVILEHRRESPVALFCLDSRPHLKLVHVPSTDIAAYASLLKPEVSA